MDHKSSKSSCPKTETYKFMSTNWKKTVTNSRSTLLRRPFVTIYNKRNHSPIKLNGFILFRENETLFRLNELFFFFSQIMTAFNWLVSHVSKWTPCFFVRGLMSYLRYLCLFCVYTYCVVFLFCFLRLVYPIVPVSLDCSFLIAPSVFSKVFFIRLGLMLGFF